MELYREACSCRVGGKFFFSAPSFVAPRRGRTQRTGRDRRVTRGGTTEPGSCGSGTFCSVRVPAQGPSVSFPRADVTELAGSSVVVVGREVAVVAGGR